MSRGPKKRLTDLVAPEPPLPPRPNTAVVRVSSRRVREGQEARANPTLALKRFAERAHDKLHGPLIEWIHYPLSVGKKPLIEAYEALSAEEKDALDEQVREAFQEHHGSQVVHVYRRRKTEGELLGSSSMTTSFDEVSYLDPKLVDTYLVPASAVMLHWGMSALGDKSFEHEKEIILKPGAASQIEKVEFRENPTVEPADRIINIVKRLESKHPGGLIPIFEIRRVMPDVQGVDFDRALAQTVLKKKLYRAGESLSVVPLGAFSSEEKATEEKAPAKETQAFAGLPEAPAVRPKPKRPKPQKTVEVLDEDEVESPALEEVRVPARLVPPTEAPAGATPPFLRPPRALPAAPVAPQEGPTTPASAYLASLSPSSRRAALGSLTILARELKGEVQTIAWGDLRAPDVLRLQERLAKKYDSAYANRIFFTLRAVLRVATQLGLMPGDAYFAALEIQKIPLSTRTPQGTAVSPETLRRVFESLDVTLPRGARDAALLAVLYGTGMRRSELVRLELTDDEGSSLRVHTKRVPIDGDIRTALTRWEALRGPLPGPLFVPINYGRILTHALTEPGVLKILYDLATRAGVEPFTTQDLRRSKLDETAAAQ